jgi:hypothetical protein
MNSKEEVDEGILHARRVLRKSGWRTQFSILPPEDREAPWLLSICDRVDRFGGKWTWYCGLLFISLPPDLRYDPLEDFPVNQKPQQLGG